MLKVLTRPFNIFTPGWVGFFVLWVFCGGMALGRLLEDMTWVQPKSYPLNISHKTPSAGKLFAEYEPASALVVGATGIVDAAYQEIVLQLVGGMQGRTPVIILVSGPREKENYRQALESAGLAGAEVYLKIHRRDSIWIRDYGPLFYRPNGGALSVVDMSYSGGATKERWRDDEMPIAFANELEMPLVTVPLRLQGGNFLPVGNRALMTSTSVIRENISRGFGNHELSMLFRDQLGVSEWLCLLPLVGERTGHADQYVTTTNANTVLVASMDPREDAENAQQLDTTAEFLDVYYEVERIPLVRTADGGFRSYNNVVQVNDVVFVPRYSDVSPEVEERAFAVLSEAMPGREVIGINADSLTVLGGSLRCMTLVIPAGVPLEKWELESLGSGGE